jgi:hypothetical protein
MLFIGVFFPLRGEVSTWGRLVLLDMTLPGRRKVLVTAGLQYGRFALADTLWLPDVWLPDVVTVFVACWSIRFGRVPRSPIGIIAAGARVLVAGTALPREVVEGMGNPLVRRRGVRRTSDEQSGG